MAAAVCSRTENAGLLAAARPEGNTDARSGSGASGDLSGFGSRAGPGPDLRSEISGLPARIRSHHLLRMLLHDAGPVRRVGIGPRGPVRAQPVCRERLRRAATAATPPAPPPSITRAWIHRHIAKFGFDASLTNARWSRPKATLTRHPVALHCGCVNRRQPLKACPMTSRLNGAQQEP
jgi:hypothetical protein